MSYRCCSRALSVVVALAACSPALAEPVDRQAVVSRHNVVVRAADPFGTLSVGNGEFAFNFDITGLQTFPEACSAALPVGTMSTWGWHSFPNPEGYSFGKFKLKSIPKHDRVFEYPASGTANPTPEAAYLRANPHRFGLGDLGLLLTHADGSAATIADVKDPVQRLDLWTGLATSTFEFDGVSVRVETVAHPVRDEVAVRVESRLVAAGRLKLRLAFPHASAAFGPDYNDFGHPEAHETRLAESTPTSAVFARKLDDTTYQVRAGWSDGGTLSPAGPHAFVLSSGGDAVEMTVAFSPREIVEVSEPFAVVRALSAGGWKQYWSSGGILDLSGNADPRAAELERRIVLSQYLMRVHESGALPPQETGLIANSWFGKFHMEMYIWHAAHWALWGHPELLADSLASLERMIPAGQAMAKLERCRGTKWPKMTDPDGNESPSGVGPVLCWQQPHPIYLAELLYRANPKPETLARFSKIVFETADYMATFVDFDPLRGEYVLGPGVSPGDEKHTDVAHNLNPTMEIGYWKWALQTAQLWRARQGLALDPTYAAVIAKLAAPTVRDGVYPALEFPVESKPAFMATFLLGVLPGDGIDRAAMTRTLAADTRATGPQDAVTWGTAMAAMTALRLGDADRAMNFLAGPSNANPFRINGTTVRRPEQTPAYFPANGAWLMAAALATAGSDGHPGPTLPPGWVEHHEGLLPLP
jgi:hypothetical protein